MITSSDPRVTYSDPKVTYSDPKVTYSNPKVTYNDPTHLHLHLPPLASPGTHQAISQVLLKLPVLTVLWMLLNF